MKEDFNCPECNGTEFKKEYKSEHNIETYCTRCGLILKKDDLSDEYDNTRWLKRGFRPNSWDFCFTNHINDYFSGLSEYEILYPNKKYTDEDYTYKFNLAESKSFKKTLTGYEKYLKVNSFKDNIKSKLKYLRRYNPSEFNKYLKETNNMVIVRQSDKKDIHQPKYNYEKKGELE